MNVQVDVAAAELMKGGSWIKLPERIVASRSCVNIRSRNQECFLNCILASLKYNDVNSKKRDNPDSYAAFRDEINIQNISFPISLRDIKIFEVNNPTISVNVYKLTKDKVTGPLYLTKEEKVHHVDLLYVGKPERHHYVLIRNLSALISNQSKARSVSHFCKTCLSFFKSEDQLLFHKQIGCGKQMVTMPPLHEAHIKFERFTAKQMHPFVIYIDFEAVLQPVDSVIPNQDKSFTHVKQRHSPCSYSYVINTYVDDEFLKPLRLYRGKDCVEHFVDSVIKDVSYIAEKYLNVVRPMEKITKEKRLELNNVKICHVCTKAFKEGDEIVIDHCHFTSKARTRLHSACNLLLKSPRFLPIVMHNGSNYDFFFILPELAKRKLRLTCIPKNQEKYISFSAILESNDPLEKRSVELRFLDSLKFLDASLATLVKTLDDCPS